jgi:carbonic anhydrase
VADLNDVPEQRDEQRDDRFGISRPRYSFLFSIFYFGSNNLAHTAEPPTVLFMTIVSLIREKQRELDTPPGAKPPVHAPEMLLIGCVDARLPIQDIGIPYGKALIYRNIAALVAGMDWQAAGGRVSEAAILEFAVDVMRVRDIVVMGHTDCGGIRACLHGSQGEEKRHLRQYLSPLDEVRERVIADGGDFDAQARAMERAAVHQSVENLRSYEVVRAAEASHRLTVHGWVIDTATGAIAEMDRLGLFQPMSN